MAFQPDVGDVHVDALLTNLSIAYRNQRYIADQVFPIVMVDKQSDIIPKYTKAYWFLDSAQERAPGTTAAVSGYAVDNTNKFFCINYAIGKEIPDEVRANADLPYDMDRDGTEWVTDMLMRKRERLFSADFMTTSVWATDKVGTTDFTKWNDYGASDPIADIRTGIRAVRQATGFRANCLVMGEIVWHRLVDHPDFLDRVKHTQLGVISRDLVKSVLELEKLFVGEALYTASDEGSSTYTYSDIIDDDALLLYVADRPSLLVPSAGYTFVWRPLTGGGAQFIRRIRDDKRRKDIIEGHCYMDQVATATDAGYFFSDSVD